MSPVNLYPPLRNRTASSSTTRSRPTQRSASYGPVTRSGFRPSAQAALLSMRCVLGALRNFLILRKPRSGYLEGRTALIQSNRSFTRFRTAALASRLRGKDAFGQRLGLEEPVAMDLFGIDSLGLPSAKHKQRPRPYYFLTSPDNGNMFINGTQLLSLRASWVNGNAHRCPRRQIL